MTKAVKRTASHGSDRFPMPQTHRAIGRRIQNGVYKRINELCDTFGQQVWQRNYYEHIIRNSGELDRKRQYIIDNPARWEMDRENQNAVQVAATIKKNFEELGV